MTKEHHEHQEKAPISYTIEDAMNITGDILALSKEKEYNTGAFVHGLILTLEAVQKSYSIPQQQIAEIRRGCRRYLQEVMHRAPPKTGED
jgi:hypothetical protein